MPKPVMKEGKVVYAGEASFTLPSVGRARKFPRPWLILPP